MTHKESNTMQTIDLESIIKYKTNRKIPKFIARLVKKIICLDRINEIIVKYGKDNQGIAFAEKVLEDLNITTSIKGLENIPRNEKLIFAGGFDRGAGGRARHPKTIDRSQPCRTCVLSGAIGDSPGAGGPHFSFGPRLL